MAETQLVQSLRSEIAERDQRIAALESQVKTFHEAAALVPKLRKRIGRLKRMAEQVPEVPGDDPLFWWRCRHDGCVALRKPDSVMCEAHHPESGVCDIPRCEFLRHFEGEDSFTLCDYHLRRAAEHDAMRRSDFNAGRLIQQWDRRSDDLIATLMRGLTGNRKIASDPVDGEPEPRPSGGESVG